MHSELGSDDDSAADGGRDGLVLGLNLNPSDGHNFGYGAEWDEDVSVGSAQGAFSHDYLNQTVWQAPAKYVAIVRHDGTACEAVKVWELSEASSSMLQRFRWHNPGPGRNA